MWSRGIVGFGIYGLGTLALWQAEILSEGMVKVLEDFPVVGLVIFTLYYVSKMQRADNKQNREYLERMLEVQRQSLKEIYESQQAFVAAILSEIEVKQNNILVMLKEVQRQMSLNTSTVSEIAAVNDIVNDLIARLEKK